MAQIFIHVVCFRLCCLDSTKICTTNVYNSIISNSLTPHLICKSGYRELMPLQNIRKGCIRLLCSDPIWCSFVKDKSFDLNKFSNVMAWNNILPWRKTPFKLIVNTISTIFIDHCFWFMPAAQFFCCLIMYIIQSITTYKLLCLPFEGMMRLWMVHKSTIMKSAVTILIWQQ